MFSWKEFEKTQNILSHFGGKNYKAESGQHHIFSRPSQILEWMELLKEDLGFFTLIDIAGLDLEDNRLELVYQLLNMGTHQRLNFHLFTSRDEITPSVESFFMNANWLEREQAEMLDVRFHTIKQSLLLPAGQKNYPLKKSSNGPYSWPKEENPELPELRFNPNKSEAPFPEESYFWKQFSLLSPESSGDFEFHACFDPVKLVDLKPRIGFYHQGFEKLLEKKDIAQILQLVDKLNLSSAPNLSVSWARTIEEMFRIKIPERAQAIRIVTLELARISDHLTVLSNICMETAQNEMKLFLNAREKIYELFEKFTGHRHGLGAVRIGGVKEDLPHGWIIEFQTVADVLAKNLRIINRSLISQVKFRELLSGDPVNAEVVLGWGVSGPAMRAAGLNFDLRKSQPFYFYQDIDFDIPVGIFGTGYDRYLIRFEEIFQSLRIVTQVIDNLPLGEVIPSEFDKNYLELNRHFETLEQPAEWYYSSLEASGGETGYSVKFERSLGPARIKIKTPGFCLAQALPFFMKGLKEEQLRANFASLGISRFEMDR